MFRQAQAFTLIEILVVLLIVSIMTAVAVVKLPSLSRTGDLTTESRRIKALIELARDEALLQSNEIGFAPDVDHYAFYVYDELARSWSEMTARPFQARELGDGITLELTVESGQIQLDQEGKRRPPPILLLSSGETTVFRLSIVKASENETRVLVADGLSGLEWEQDATY